MTVNIGIGSIVYGGAGIGYRVVGIDCDTYHNPKVGTIVIENEKGLRRNIDRSSIVRSVPDDPYLTIDNIDSIALCLFNVATLVLDDAEAVEGLTELRSVFRADAMRLASTIVKERDSEAFDRLKYLFSQM